MKGMGLALRLSLVAASLAVMTLGALALGGGAGDAAAGPRVTEVSATAGGPLPWTIENAAPGASVRGTVRISRVREGDRLEVSFEPGDGEQILAEHLFVTAVSAGEEDLLAPWSAACAPGALSLARLAGCGALPVPGDANVLASFGMTLQVDPAAGNELQGVATTAFDVRLSLDRTGAATRGKGNGRESVAEKDGSSADWAALAAPVTAALSASMVGAFVVVRRRDQR